MNILIIDTNTCNLEKAKYIHEWLSEQLDNIFTLPSCTEIGDGLKYLIDYMQEKEKREKNNGTNS